MARGKILIIDDEIEVREFFQDFFEDRDFEVTAASNGRRGVEIFGQGEFDLIICDMMMPGMIGLEVLEHVKKIKQDQRIIMLTGVSEKSMVERAEALGCSHYLNKPVSLDALEKQVNACLESENH